MKKATKTVLSDLEAIRAEQIKKAKQLYFVLNEFTMNSSKSINATIRNSFC